MTYNAPEHINRQANILHLHNSMYIMHKSADFLSSIMRDPDPLSNTGSASDFEEPFPRFRFFFFFDFWLITMYLFFMFGNKYKISTKFLDALLCLEYQVRIRGEGPGAMSPLSLGGGHYFGIILFLKTFPYA